MRLVDRSLVFTGGPPQERPHCIDRDLEGPGLRVPAGLVREVTVAALGDVDRRLLDRRGPRIEKRLIIGGDRDPPIAVPLA